MEENQVRASVAPAPIPNANGMELLETVPMLSLKFDTTDWDTGRSKVVTRNYEWLNPKADAKDVYDFAKMLEEVTECNGILDVIVVHKTSINL